MSNNAALVEGLSGAAGAVIALAVTYPLIKITTNQAVRKTSGHDERKSAPTALQEIIRTCQTSGPSALYKGLQPAVIGTVVSQGVYFYLYAYLRRLFTENAPGGVKARNQQISVGTSLLVASLAGSANVLLTNPIWLVVTRMQTATGPSQQKKNFLQVFKEIYAESGILGCWRGVVPSLVMVSNPTVQYVLYELLVSKWLQRRRTPLGVMANNKLSDLEIFGLSALAKLGATISTYPLLVIKNKVQSARKATAVDRHASAFQLIADIWKGEGVWGFFKGIRTKIVQSIVAAALMFMIKERIYETTATALRSIEAIERPSVPAALAKPAELLK